MIANKITKTGTLTIQANGGDGGAGAPLSPDTVAGGGNGGGGGGGGVVLVALREYTAGDLVLEANGGAGGSNSTSNDPSTTATAGSSGTAELYQILDDGDGTFSLSGPKNPATESWSAG